MGNTPLVFSGRNVTAVLGPTNTGKTHLAIERMLAHESGIIGLPLRLLAREVYNQISTKIGSDKVSLITGEEKIQPPKARYCVCTVEAMPRETSAAFVAIDEVQLANDLERGHIFTDRILHLRGREETFLLGSLTMRSILERLLRGITIVSRPRLSQLSYNGSKKIARLPPRSAIVAFNSDEVYAIAEFIRRQRGGAAVVMGALSPRTRNAQVELYQAGDVDFLVATDAIGMGLNLDVNHVAFAQTRKFDGFQFRDLNPSELAQIAGRAGRYLSNGTFGVTGRVIPFEADIVEKIEGSFFEPNKVMQWRTAHMDFSSLDSLRRSLDRPSPIDGLVKAMPAVDVRALDCLMQNESIVQRIKSSYEVKLLWDVCALPDYRKISPAQHADIIATLFRDIEKFNVVDENYVASQIALANRIDGDIDTLSHRIAQIRTWTYVSHQPNWLADPQYWQEKTREIEDKLSDALHERLTKRFIDRKTSVLMKRLREKTMIDAEISKTGDVLVEGHHVGRLEGFRFTMDKATDGSDVKAVRAAAQIALAPEYDARAERFSACGNSDLMLASDGIVRWVGEPIASLVSGDEFLKPRIVLLADEQLQGTQREKVSERVARFVAFHFETALKPLFDLINADALVGITRGIAFQLVEQLGVLPRRDIANDVKSLDQDSRAALRRLGVRFGAYHIFIPALLKPSPAQAITLLWALQNNGKEQPGYGDVIQTMSAGRTSIAVNSEFNPEFYRLAGYRILGKRAVRVDILERLADFIRPALSWREGAGPRPEGAYDGRQFIVTPSMMSILGASHADMEDVLKSLGYRSHTISVAEVEAKLHEGNETTHVDLLACEPVGPMWASIATDETPKSSEEVQTPSDSVSAKDGVEDIKVMLLWRYQMRHDHRQHKPRDQNQHRNDDKKKFDRKPKAASGSSHEGQRNQHVDKSRHDQPHEKREKSGQHEKAGFHKGGRNNERRSSQQTKDFNKSRKHESTKAMDPDSPFAKLAQLREQLKK